jgi:2-polyprenyl-3-methyl-5-hydroxy-6-metoxy-1,4-benzoquinol methylase
MKVDWNKAQEYELNWHSTCANSLYEEEKQIVYAEKMGLIRTPTPKTPYNFDLNGASIIDIGGGAYSLLLKCVNYGKATVVDPLMDKFPSWVKERYKSVGINTNGIKGEELDISDDSLVDFEIYDECWIYNVLEHCESPKKIIENAKNHGKIIRIFEWLDTPFSVGHPQTLREEELNEWLGGEGKTEILKRGSAKGKAFWGIFKGRYYEQYK